ncbi:hypothetical protein [Spongiimicrobium sp. 3-5]|uniref:hypothetical protein n=1 Tax=Spongiimicrobium sp. 3-5 TaxID=3332596 RepID=UPI00397FC8C6
MHKKEIVNLDRIINQTTSEINFGTQLEMLAANKKGKEVDVGLYPLCRFICAKKGSIQFEIYDDNRIIRLPIEELENSILAAKKWVQSEDSFDYSDDS